MPDLPLYAIGCNHAGINPDLKIKPRLLRDRRPRTPSAFGVGELGESLRTLVTDDFIDDEGWYHLVMDNVTGGAGSSAVIYRSAGGRDCWEFQHRLDANVPLATETVCR
ncbi:MAG: hypothetical protein GDA49_01920 [Rhodospirillales bacterium]|nr:hypothetical protein [Rhodospirillales bacterium]